MNKPQGSTFDLRQQIPRIGERVEILVAWYLRFNGFFPLPNFILHDAGDKKEVGQQLTEADVLGVRLSFTKELISTPDGTICTLVDPRLKVRAGTSDFLIGEVSSQECKFNWLDRPEADQRLFFTYVLRRFGYWPERELAAIVKRLHAKQVYEAKTVRVRLLSFGVRPSSAANWPKAIQEVTLEETLEYMRKLFACYGQKPNSAGSPIVSDHQQWHPLIREIYNRLLGPKVDKQTPTEIVDWLTS